MEAAAFSENTKTAMKKQVLKKMRAHSDALVEFVEVEVEEFPGAPDGSDPAKSHC